MNDALPSSPQQSAPKEEDRYIRVGTKHYKIVEAPRIDGTKRTELLPWSLKTITEDHGKGYAKTIPHYDKFVVVPENINFQQVVDDKFYNLFQPLKWTPEPGDFTLIDQFLGHLFGEQKEFAYDYLQLLYRCPAQPLPVIVLVSRERNTGKSTFIKFLRELFGENVTFNTSDIFGNRFNAEWAPKLLICTDEAVLEKREMAERIKYLSTSPVIKMEAKGKDRVEIEFFGKFVFCSNDVERPIIIEPGETRYWVREVPPLEYDDVNFLDKLKEEIPHLLYHLQHRELSVPKSSRMYFPPVELFTPALQRIMLNSRSPIEAALFDLCDDILSTTGIDALQCIPRDLRLLLPLRGVRTDDISVRHVLKDIWRLRPQASAGNYQRVTGEKNNEEGYCFLSAKGRYFTVSRELLKKLIEKCRFVAA